MFVWEVSEEPGFNLHWVETTTGDTDKVCRHQRPGLDVAAVKTHTTKGSGSYVPLSSAGRKKVTSRTFCKDVVTKTNVLTI